MWIRIFLFLLISSACTAETYHHLVAPCGLESYVWRQNESIEFKELILTWNSRRPPEGTLHFSISLKRGGAWTPWISYMDWGHNRQTSYDSRPLESIHSYIDTISIENGPPATGFRIRISTSGGATLTGLEALHLWLGPVETSDELSPPDEEIYLPVPGISQMTLAHRRSKDLCSPTSTVAVVDYLLGEVVDPVHFAQLSRDSGFDIYGNWVFNCAQAFDSLKGTTQVWVEKLAGFQPILEDLKAGIPTVVSVRSPLPGSAQEYKNGHLMAVIGYDPKEQLVHCMDPAFPEDDETFVSYSLKDFLQAWHRRDRVAYRFSPKVN